MFLSVTSGHIVLKERLAIATFSFNPLSRLSSAVIVYLMDLNIFTFLRIFPFLSRVHDGFVSFLVTLYIFVIFSSRPLCLLSSVISYSISLDSFGFCNEEYAIPVSLLLSNVRITFFDNLPCLSSSKKPFVHLCTFQAYQRYTVQ